MKKSLILSLVWGLGLVATSAFAMGKKPSEQPKSLLCSVTRMEQKVSQIEIPLSDFVPTTDTDFAHARCSQVFDVDYPDWDQMGGSCEPLSNSQRIDVCEFNLPGLTVPSALITVRYSVGPQGFDDDIIHPTGPAGPYTFYDPQFQVQELEKGKPAKMTNSDFAPAYGPNIDVVCVIGDQEKLDSETEAYEARLAKKRFADYDKAYNERKQACSSHQ